MADLKTPIDVNAQKRLLEEYVKHATDDIHRRAGELLAEIEESAKTLGELPAMDMTTLLGKSKVALVKTFTRSSPRPLKRVQLEFDDHFAIEMIDQRYGPTHDAEKIGSGTWRALLFILPVDE
jgi:hypothetical protein